MPSTSAAEFDPCEISQRIYRVKTLRQSGSEILKFGSHLWRKICSYPHCKQIAISLFSNRLRPLLSHRARFEKKIRVIASFRRSIKPRYRLRNLASCKTASLKPLYFAIKSDFTLASRGNFAPLCRFKRDSALPPPSASATSAKSYDPQ